MDRRTFLGVIAGGLAAAALPAPATLGGVFGGVADVLVPAAAVPDGWTVMGWAYGDEGGWHFFSRTGPVGEPVALPDGRLADVLIRDGDGVIARFRPAGAAPDVRLERVRP